MVMKEKKPDEMMIMPLSPETLNKCMGLPEGLYSTEEIKEVHERRKPFLINHKVK